MAQRFSQWLSGGLLLFTWLMVAQSYAHLPPSIPVHFDAGGQADNWGPRASIWFLPVLATALFGFFSLLRRYAHKFPRKSGPEVPDHTGAIRALFGQLRFATALVFCVDIYYMIVAALRGQDMSGRILVPFTTLLFATPVLLFLFRVLKKRRVPPAS